MLHHLRQNSRLLYDTAVRCDVTLQNCNASGLHERVIVRSDDIRIQIVCVCDILTNGFSADCHNRRVEQVAFCKLLHYCIYSACSF